MRPKAISVAFIAALLAAATPSAMAQSRSSSTSKASAANASTSTSANVDSGTSVPNALQGFQQNRGQPVQIEAARLEVRDKDKVATFTGNVKVVQGDTTMHCKVLVVYYEQKKDEAQGAPGAQAGPQTMKAATPGPGGSSQISRLEAKGSVVVTQKDQTATGDNGLFDMKSNTVTMTGNVLVSQGPNVLRGERLVVDLTTGVSRVDAGSSNGPVRMLIQQGPPGAPQPNAPQGTPQQNIQQGSSQPNVQQGSSQPSSPAFSGPRFSPQRVY
jgi:lipopolysaccharide export system protein LptA